MIRILVTGDYCPAHRIISLTKAGKYQDIFNDCLPLIRESDISITNLECPLIEDGKTITKTGPCLKGPKETALILNAAGFDLVTLANNHIMDYGRHGLVSTLESCSKHSISTVGAGLNLDQAREAFIRQVRGQKVAILNYCENEWSTAHGELPGANPLNPVNNYYDIKSAKENVKYVIVIVHGGHEYYNCPSPRMKELYRFFIDAGADAVVGHHSHCFSGYEIYRKSPIFYSLGNFSFDREGETDSAWNLGYAVELIMAEHGIEFNIHPYKQGSVIPGIVMANRKGRKSIDEEIKALSSIITDDDMLQEHYSKMCALREKEYLAMLEPYCNLPLSWLKAHRMLPSLVSKSKKRLMLNLIRCESHRDILIWVLGKQLGL